MNEKPVESLNFEQAITELEAVVKRLESGDLPLADSLAAYQRGAALMRHAQAMLDHVQSEIDVMDASGATSLDRSALIAQVKESSP